MNEKRKIFEGIGGKKRRIKGFLPFGGRGGELVSLGCTGFLKEVNFL